jgi:RNA polymerase sigma-70 factor, ECF subfamily
MDTLQTAGDALPLGWTSDRGDLEMFDSNPARTLDEREFMEHWSAARQPLRSFALRLCRDRTQADDLMQQTALQAWTARNRLPSVNNVIAWFAVILRNCYYEVLRRRKYEVADPDAVIAANVATAPAHELQIETEEMSAALRRLPAEQRRALTLVVFEGLSYAEAGRACGCKEGTIKSRIARARDRLNQALESGAAGHPFAGRRRRLVASLALE